MGSKAKMADSLLRGKFENFDLFKKELIKAIKEKKTEILE